MLKIRQFKASSFDKAFCLKIGAKFLIAIFLVFFIFFASTDFAKDLGVWGTVYPITEQDFKQFIYLRLKNMQKSGELARANEKFLANVKEHTLRPKPVTGLTTTKQPKTFFYNPTFVLKRDIKDASGNIIYKQGAKINPLEKFKLHEVLFFLNADDQRQINWAEKIGKKYPYVKYILVQGNIKDAGNALKNRVYFDQYGLLTKKLDLKHIPCLVEQQGTRLMIKEFALKEKT